MGDLDQNRSEDGDRRGVRPSEMAADPSSAESITAAKRRLKADQLAAMTRTVFFGTTPGLKRPPKPDNVADVLAWAQEPLATAEVAAIARVDMTDARNALGRIARPTSAGAELFWTAA